MDSRLIVLDRPTYDPEAVVPMRRELTAVGFEELLSPEEVDAAFQTLGEGEVTTLIVLNSVCGCAAGNARPGVALALQNARIPDKLLTVFAGMEKAAVARVREMLAPNPASSPSMALFKGQHLEAMIHRRDIETRTADQVASLLVSLFDEHCSATGPSIPPEIFASMEMAKFCGSKLPLYQGS